MIRKGLTSLIPVIVTLLSVTAFLVVLNFAITPNKQAPTNTSIGDTMLANSADANLNDADLGNKNTNVVANTNASANDEMKGWKTHTNSDYAYEIKYPETYVVSGSKQQVKLEKGQLGKSDVHSVQILVMTPWNLSSFNEEVNSWYTWAKGDYKTQTTFSGQRTKKLGSATFTIFDFDQASGSSDNDAYFYVTGDVVYLLVDERLSDKKTATNETIISTFKATGIVTDPTAGWKTYTDTTYGWTAKYPPNWFSAQCQGSTAHTFSPEQISCQSEGVNESFIVYQESAGFNFEAKIAELKKDKSIDNFSQTSITVAGTTATRLTGTFNQSAEIVVGSRVDNVYVLHNDRYVVLNHDGKASMTSNDNTFANFLSTLTFTK